MFGRFHQKSPDAGPPSQNIRDTLFGDMPIDAHPPHPTGAEVAEPWQTFARAREALAAGRPADAKALWHGILAMKDLESRHYLQAWHFLRGQGDAPSPQQAKVLLGVVVEVPMQGGLDLLAAYSDHHARYFNFTGAGVVWEHPDSSLDAHIDALLLAGEKILGAIGPWTSPRPPAPPTGQLRLNLLSPAGLHFGQGPMNALAADPMAKDAINSAVALMQELIARGKGGSSKS